MLSAEMFCASVVAVEAVTMVVAGVDALDAKAAAMPAKAVRNFFTEFSLVIFHLTQN